MINDLYACMYENTQILVMHYIALDSSAAKQNLISEKYVITMILLLLCYINLSGMSLECI